MREQPLDMWVIYDHPTDFPDVFVARRWEILRAEHATGDVKTHATLEGLRELIATETLCDACITRSPGDEAVVVETWL